MLSENGLEDILKTFRAVSKKVWSIIEEIQNNKKWSGHLRLELAVPGHERVNYSKTNVL